MKLYTHQKRFLDANPDNALLVWETGTGKTLAACEWIKKRADKPALVVCPKAIVGKWQRDLKESGAKAIVLTRDEVKKTNIAKYRAIVLDEAQDFASPLFTKQRSARATKIYQHLKEHADTHVLLLTATPVRSTPWNIHTLAMYLRHVWPKKAFSDEFEYLTDIYGRYHLELKSDWRTKVRPYVEEVADIVLMKDCIDVPKQHDQVIRLQGSKLPANTHYESPSERWYTEHRHEQHAKLSKLRELLDGYRKAIVVCQYTEQIEEIHKEFAKERAVYVLQGSTKDQDKVIADAKHCDDAVFIIQASMGAGFDASEFSVVIFASMSFRYVDYVQMRGRVKRINNLHENVFIHMLAGRYDEAVYNRIMQGQDFDVHHDAKNNL